MTDLTQKKISVDGIGSTLRLRALYARAVEQSLLTGLSSCLNILPRSVPYQVKATINILIFW